MSKLFKAMEKVFCKVEISGLYELEESKILF